MSSPSFSPTLLRTDRSFVSFRPRTADQDRQCKTFQQPIHYSAQSINGFELSTCYCPGYLVLFCSSEHILDHILTYNWKFKPNHVFKTVE